MPTARFAPIHVDDVARAFADSLDNPATYGQTYDLCGPKDYTLQELVSYVGEVIGKKRSIIPLGEHVVLPAGLGDGVQARQEADDARQFLRHGCRTMSAAAAGRGVRFRSRHRSKPSRRNTCAPTRRARATRATAKTLAAKRAAPP